MAHLIETRKASRSRFIDRAALERIARISLGTVLDGESLRDAEVSVLLVDDPEMRELNRRWRGKDGTTDVLSFPMAERREWKRPGAVLGDIVISLPTARRQAVEAGHSLEAELALLLVHGALHLLGYDHETDRDARRMRKKERQYVSRTP